MRKLLLLLLCLPFTAYATGQCYQSGVTDQYTYFVAVDSTDFTTRETGLSSFTVYRSRDGAAAAAMTTPTINETDTTNMPGVYELLLDEDMTIGASNVFEEMSFHITATGMAPVTKTICIADLADSTDRVTDVETAIDNKGLDMLFNAAVVNADVVNGSFASELVSDDATPDYDSYDNTTDSLEALQVADAARDTAIATVDGNVDTLITEIGTNGDGLTVLTDDLTAIRGATSLHSTTIATVTSQTSFTLTDGSTDDAAYADSVIIVTDQTTSTQKEVALIASYTGSTKTVALYADPGVFTIAASDLVDIIPAKVFVRQMETGIITSDTFANFAVGSTASAAILSDGFSDSGTTTTLVDAALTQANDYWNDQVLVVSFSGLSKQARCISDFDSATDTITVSTAFDTAVSTHNYAILPSDSCGASGGGGDITAISGDTAAADNLEALLDGTGGVTLSADSITASTLATDAIGAAELAADAIGASEIANDAIDATAIATDSIGATEIAADAIGASELATDAIGAAEIAASAIGSAELATDAITADELAAAAVEEIRALQTGTCDSGTTSTCVDAALTEADDDYWQKGIAFMSTSGSTNGQSACVYDFDQATDTLSFRPAMTQAISTNTYMLISAPLCGGVVAP